MRSFTGRTQYWRAAIGAVVVCGVLTVPAGFAGALALPPKPATPGELFPIAGGSLGPSLGNGGPALIKAELNDPTGVAVDNNGNVFIADTDDNEVREVTPNGIINDVAGTGVAGYTGDSGPGYVAELNHPEGVAVDNNGDVFIADTGNNVIREVNSSGVISTIAGNGTAGYEGDGLDPISAELNAPYGVAVSTSGQIAIADTGNSVIREITFRLEIDNSSPLVAAHVAAMTRLVAPRERPNFFFPLIPVINTVAGLGYASPNLGDGGPATQAGLNYPTGVAFDSNGDIDIADTGNSAIRSISADDDDISTIVHTPYPTGVAVGPTGLIYATNPFENQVEQINDGVVTPMAGTGVAGFGGFYSKAVNAKLNLPQGVAVDQYGDVFFSDSVNEVTDEVVVARAPTFSAFTPPLVVAAGTTYSYQFNALGVPSPTSYALTSAPSWMSISSSGLVKGTPPSGTQTFTFGVKASNAEGPTSEGPFTVTVPMITNFGGSVGPVNIVKGPDGALWYTNFLNNSIGRITTNGIVHTYRSPFINQPFGITVGPDNAIWFTDLGNNTIGRLTVTGVFSFFNSTKIKKPFAITSGPNNALWFTNSGNNTIGRITVSGTVTAYSSPTIKTPEGITLAANNNLYFTNNTGNSIGRITLLGAVGVATSASISKPVSITTGPDGALWFTNSGNNSVGRMTLAGVVTHFANAEIDQPEGIVSGPDSSLWFTNSLGNSIEQLSTSGVFTNYFLTGLKDPLGLTVGPDGALWAANYNNSSIARFTPAGIEQFGNTLTPAGMALGPDGAFWYANSLTNSISRITTTGTVRTFTGSGIDDPLGIVAGPDGAMWFTNYGDNTIGTISMTGVVSYFSGVGISGPVGITSDNGALWFTNHNNNSIGRITTTGVITNYTGAGISGPFDITAGPEDLLWFTNNTGNSIGTIDPVFDTVETYHSVEIDRPVDIVTGPSGNNLWFTNNASNSIGSITEAGVVTRYTDPSIKGPEGIAVGLDNALWFTNNSGSSIGRITTTGSVSNWLSSTISDPVDIIAGPDSALWFTNGGNASIGRITG